MDSVDDFNKNAYLVRLGKNIERVRKSKAYSQDRASLEAGLARGTLSKIEQGKVEPKITTLVLLAFVLGVPAKRLIDVPLE